MEVRAHGALIDVRGVGVLLLGPSGIGKSECALELVHRGHRLVADDVVLLRREPDGTLMGRAPKVIRHYLEIRGIGLLFIPELYGPDSVRGESRVELVCRLQKWREGEDYERVGLDRPIEELAGVALPALLLPTRPAGSMATLVEVAARDHRLRQRGASAAERLDEAFSAGQGADPEPAR